MVMKIGRGTMKDAFKKHLATHNKYKCQECDFVRTIIIRKRHF